MSLRKLAIVLISVFLAGAIYFFLISPGDTEVKVLVFSKSENFRHESIPDGVRAIEQLGEANNFTVFATEDATYFREDFLQDFHAIVFLNTTGDVLDPIQQSQMERFIQAGGGFVGVHSATDTEYGWPWYGQLVGAYFESHPNDPHIQEAKLSVVNPNHRSTDSIPATWMTSDEWYNFKSIDPASNVLITVDESSYIGGTNGEGHPISWYKEYDGGRSFYTALGHIPEKYEDPTFLRHLRGGIQYAIGTASLDYSKAYSDAVPEENRFSRVTFLQNLNEPMELDFLSSERIIFAERHGTVSIYDLASGERHIAAELDVFDGLEDGLLGVAVDPNFAQNKWVYLYYSENGSDHVQNLSRFIVEGDSLDLSSEKILLQVPTQREQCCHSGGSLEFGPDGNLYLSTGDNTNPHESNGFAPIDERDGRSPWDAQKSSANTNDLRGKILRIRPEPDGTYSIPEGNLFMDDDPLTHPEIYVMGNRNPYRISIDSRTGYLYWGEVGPDANKDSLNTGVRGYDEVNQAKEAGFFGWPYFIADNKAYHDFDFVTNQPGEQFDTRRPVNDSPNNTGLENLPPAQPAMIYYPYADSPEFPQLGSGSRNAMAGPIYYSEDFAPGDRNWPDYFDGKPLIYDWMRGWIFAVTMKEDGSMDKMTRIVPNMDFHNVIDMAFGPDGALYFLEYGTGWFAQNIDATLSRIDFTAGNRVPVARITTDKSIGAAPLTTNFSARNSIDYDGDQLTYAWDFGDNSTSTDANLNHVYEETGTYRVTLQVTDSEGQTAATELQVMVGNELPELEWEIQAGNSQFYWPDEPIRLQYNVMVSDLEDGNLADGTLDESRVVVSHNYLPQGSDMVAAAKDHAEMAEEAFVSIGKTLVDGSDCMACHKTEGTSIGPSYTQVAERYREDKEAPARLVSKIINGGGGNWGETAMAAHPGINQTEAEQIVQYILSIGSNQSGPGNRLPVTGTFINRSHLDEPNGTYILTASYTDQGGGQIEPLSARQTLHLRHPLLQVETFDEGKAMKFKVIADQTPGASEDMDVVIGNSGDYFMFRGLDLTGVSGIKGSYAVVPGITQGGMVEYRLGSPDGELIGAQEIVVSLTEDFLGMPELSWRTAQPLEGIHDLYVVFKPNQGEEDGIITVMDWLELVK